MTEGWKFAAASVIGTSHLKNEHGSCQDSHLCAYYQAPNTLVAVVSDGAGSASHSEIGSTLACSLVHREIVQAPEDHLFTRTFALSTLELLRAALRSEAAQAGLRVREFACTLLVAIVGNERAAFWQIGDGAICFRKATDEGLHYAFWPAKGEYANVTEFVTDENASEELSFDEGALCICDLAVFSDGLERLALDFRAGEVHEPFFSALFPYLYRRQEGHLVDLEEQMKAFLDSDRVNSRTDDDKTLVLATRKNDAA